jgi:hypothetical protein
LRVQSYLQLHVIYNLADDIPAFTYLLKEGSGDIKIGRILFEKEGLNEMLNQAKK